MRTSTLPALAVLALILTQIATPVSPLNTQTGGTPQIIKWVRYINPTDENDYATGTCVFGNYVAVVGDANMVPYVALLDKNSGAVIREWASKEGELGGVFANCISIGGKLYVVGIIGGVDPHRVIHNPSGVIYVFDENLNIIKKAVDNHSIFYTSITYDGNYLYIGGLYSSSEHEFGWIVEKRTIDLDIVDFKEVNLGLELWISAGGDIGVNPATGNIWVVGAYGYWKGVDANHSLIMIFDNDLNVVKTIDYSERDESYLGSLDSICFDDDGYAYIAGDYGIAKFDPRGNLVTINKEYYSSKILCIGNKIYAFRCRYISDYVRHVLMVLDRDLNIVDEYVLSRDVNANSYCTSGKTSFDGESIYVAGIDEALGENNRRIVVYAIYASGISTSVQPTQTTTTITTTTPVTSTVTVSTLVEVPLQLYVNASTAFSYVLIPYSSDMWLVAIRGDGPMIGRIAEKYFNKIVEGPAVWNYTVGDWYVVGVKYLTTVEGYPQYKLYQFFSVARRGDLVVAVIRYINVGEEVTLT